jgi:hypothetical protein
MESKIFTSVIGFDFKLDLVDNAGEPIRTGATRVECLSSETPNVGTKIGGESCFTKFNEPLIKKIRDYSRRND